MCRECVAREPIASCPRARHFLEDHPNYYVREIDDIVVKNTLSKHSQTEKCWVYFLKNFKPELLQRPFYDNYDSLGSHGLQYMDRSKRDPKYNHKSELKIKSK
ncbi:hypothetical protein HF086_015778 [Spodoptera exigua]|uniref:Uncharacterized protein n=1 Tax=Spodoptera exigua TaxID=7107 RepID=A0A922SA22_SPOEX|nr:hypothetical protein HF086_015778 [Spodoptera exigua]